MRLAKGATKQQAIEEICKKLFAPQGLQSVPPILEWWDEETRPVVVNLRARELRQKRGLK